MAGNAFTLAVRHVRHAGQPDDRPGIAGVVPQPHRERPQAEFLLYVARDVQLIDSAHETAAETARVLDAAGLRAQGSLTCPHRFVASDAPEQFLRMGQRFLGTAIDRVETVTLG